MKSNSHCITGKVQLQFHNGTFLTGWVNASFERKESVVDTDFPGGSLNKIFEIIEFNLRKLVYLTYALDQHR